VLQLEIGLAAALRGHLLLQLVHRAASEKLEGNCAALQDLVRPLQLATADPSTAARDLGELAGLLVGLRLRRTGLREQQAEAGLAGSARAQHAISCC
jgi:hypothetical protein